MENYLYKTRFELSEVKRVDNWVDTKEKTP